MASSPRRCSDDIMTSVSKADEIGARLFLSSRDRCRVDFLPLALAAICSARARVFASRRASGRSTPHKERRSPASKTASFRPAPAIDEVNRSFSIRLVPDAGRLFSRCWKEEFIVLYEDSSMAWFKDKSRSDPEVRHTCLEWNGDGRTFDLK